jgi:hypothetical protein
MAYTARHNHHLDRIAMEVAPSKLPRVAARGSSRLAVVLDTIQEDDDREQAAVGGSPMAASSSSSSCKASRRGMEVVADTPMHCVAAFLVTPAMAETGCLKIRA